MTSNFSFSHNVNHSYVSLVCQNVALCGNGLTQRVLWFEMDIFNKNTV